MENKKILVGVTGGIAAYKTCELVRLLVKQDCAVKVVMTENAAKLVSPVTFQSLSKSPVFIDTFARINESSAGHIALAKWADIAVVAPATANTIGKIANGIADNLLTTIAMALPETTPVFVAPAMNVNMWDNVFNQKNLERLGLRKNTFIIGPDDGLLADGSAGTGRMSEPQVILAAIKKAIG